MVYVCPMTKYPVGLLILSPRSGKNESMTIHIPALWCMVGCIVSPALRVGLHCSVYIQVDWSLILLIFQLISHHSTSRPTIPITHTRAWSIQMSLNVPNLHEPHGNHDETRLKMLFKTCSPMVRRVLLLLPP